MDSNLSSIFRPLSSERGISLIELIMFIVIVSVALAGILLVMNVTTRGSADPLIHKQSLAIAESILEEVVLMPFTFCDPDDANATTATGPGLAVGECATLVEGLGLENDVDRYDPSTPYDNVSDYHGFAMAANSILDITNTNTGVNGYRLDAIVITPISIATASPVPMGEALQVTVSVTGPDNVAVVVDGIRTRYAPRAVP